MTGAFTKRFRDALDRYFSSRELETLNATTLEVGEYTEIYETDNGTTIVRNTEGNPINIRRSPTGRAYLSQNTTQTTISEQNTWYTIEGSWDGAHLVDISHDGAGGLQYEGLEDTQISYTAGGSYTCPSNNADFEIAVFKNGTVKERTIMPFSPARQDEILSLPLMSGFTNTVTHEMTHDLRVRCTSGVTNLTVSGMSFTVSN